MLFRGSFTLTDNPSNTQMRLELGHAPTQELIGIVTGAAPLTTRAIAMRYLLGTNTRTAPQYIPRLGNPDFVLELLAGTWVSRDLVSITAENFRKTGEPLGPMVALLSRETCWKDAIVVDDVMPPEKMAGAVPGWALDKFTREGRTALSRFLGTDASTAKWLAATRVISGKRLEVLGKALFIVESSLMGNRISWRTGDEVRRQAELSCLGVPDASELLDLLRADLPWLNELRRQVIGGTLQAH